MTILVCDGSESIGNAVAYKRLSENRYCLSSWEQTADFRALRALQHNGYNENMGLKKTSPFLPIMI